MIDADRYCRSQNNDDNDDDDKFQTRYPSVFKAEITDFSEEGSFFLSNYFSKAILTTGIFGVRV